MKFSSATSLALFLGIVLSGLSLAIRSHEVSTSALSATVPLLASAAIFLTRRESQWRWIAVGWAIEGLARSIDGISGRELSASGSAFYAIAMTCSSLITAITGIVILGRRMPSMRLTGMLDWTIVMVAVSMLWWIAVIEPSMTPNAPASEGYVQLATSSLFIALIAIIVRLASVRENRLPSFWFLTAGLASGIVGILTAAIFNTGENASYANSGLNPTGIMMFAFAACGAIHPSAAELARRLHKDVRATQVSMRLVLLVVALAITPFTAVIEVARQHHLSPVWTIGSAIMLITVGARVSAVMREQRRIEKVLAANAEREAALAELGRHAVKGIPFIELLNLASQFALNLLKADAAWTFKIQNRDTDTLQMTFRTKHSASNSQEISSKSNYIIEQTRLHGEYVGTLPAHAESDLDRLLFAQKTRNCAFVTIPTRNDIFGVIGVTSSHNKFEPQDVAFLQSLASTLGGAVIRSEVEAELQQSQRLEAVGRLAGGIAHEINTPMQFIADNMKFANEALVALSKHIDDIKGGKLTNNDDDVSFYRSEAPAALDEALKGAERVSEIVRATKAFGLSGSDKAEPFDINQALRDTVTVAHSAIEPVADLEFELAEIGPVFGRVRDLNEAFLHLISNATDAVAAVHSRTGAKGFIRISTKKDDKDCVIAISDSGPGIPTQIQSKIFDQFFTTKDVGGGTGQGLSIVRSTVQAHGGTVSFNTSTAGTTFLIRIPITGEIAPSDDHAQTAVPSSK